MLVSYLCYFDIMQPSSRFATNKGTIFAQFWTILPNFPPFLRVFISFMQPLFLQSDSSWLKHFKKVSVHLSFSLFVCQSVGPLVHLLVHLLFFHCWPKVTERSKISDNSYNPKSEFLVNKMRCILIHVSKAIQMIDTFLVKTLSTIFTIKHYIYYWMFGSMATTMRSTLHISQF